MDDVAPGIPNCVLRFVEISNNNVKMIIEKVFQNEAELPAGGSPFQRWYRQNASLSTSVRDHKGRRLIAWKTDKPFLPENLFFRTVDTCRLLPMALAQFQVQLWADPTAWEHLKQSGVAQNRITWCANIVLLMVYSIFPVWHHAHKTIQAHELILLRNMHDQGGGNITILAVSWDEETIDGALDYWVELSTGTWSESERQSRCQSTTYPSWPLTEPGSYLDDTTSNLCRRLLPTFQQADILLRALYSDLAPPPFIILLPLSPNSKSRVLFTKPSHVLPQAFAQSWPSCCLNPACADPSCGMVDFTKSRCLAEGSAMVSEGPLLPQRVICNLWGCEQKRHGGDIRMKGCERCKEVIYCNQMHQVPFRPFCITLFCYSPMFVCCRHLIGGSIGKSVRGGCRIPLVAILIFWSCIMRSMIHSWGPIRF